MWARPCLTVVRCDLVARKLIANLRALAQDILIVLVVELGLAIRE